MLKKKKRNIIYSILLYVDNMLISLSIRPTNTSYKLILISIEIIIQDIFSF